MYTTNYQTLNIYSKRDIKLKIDETFIEILKFEVIQDLNIVNKNKYPIEITTQSIEIISLFIII